MATNFLTPYAIDDTVIPAAGLRRQLQKAVGPGSGVVSAGDLRVSQLDVPGTGIKIAAGDVLVQSRAPGRHRETYGVSLPADGTVDGLDGTGSGGAGVVRRDMVIHEIIDRDPEAGAHFTDPSTVPGVDSLVTVVQGVDLTATTVADVPALNNVTCYELATIDYPASTATITDDMITVRARPQTPFRREFMWTLPPSPSLPDADYLNAKTSAGGEEFPGNVGKNTRFAVKFPEEATLFHIRASIEGIGYGDEVFGDWWLEFGDELKPGLGWPGLQAMEFRTPRYFFNSPAASANSQLTTWTMSTQVEIPEKLRGEWVTFLWRAGVADSVGSNKIWAKYAGLACDLTFLNDTALPGIPL